MLCGSSDKPRKPTTPAERKLCPASKGRVAADLRGYFGFKENPRLAPGALLLCTAHVLRTCPHSRHGLFPGLVRNNANVAQPLVEACWA